MIMKGQKINDRYQIVKSIGEGGMANVYLAYDTILDRNVAVKVLRGDLSNDEKFVRRFQREALAASSLSNQNIVEVYDVGEDDGEYYIVMEYIEGKQLKQLLKKRGKLTISEAVDIVMQITEGLSVAHDSYIIHRDIKPQNIMILENGLVKITDFGIAMAMNSTQLTQTNSVMGSVHYLPPEQASGRGATLQSDIYSIGILFYELLTGKLPFKGENAVEIALKHLKESIPSIKEEIPSLPQSVENIITKATAKNPKNRYKDAREMYEDLKTCLDPARKDEPKITLKYQEVSDDTKVIKQIKDENMDNKKTDDVKVKKISKDSLTKQNKMLITIASIFTGLVIVTTVIFVLFMLGVKTKGVKVPDVSNKSVKDAIKILQEAGFEVADKEEETISENVKEGLVAKTSPLADSKKKKGTKVTLYVSIGNGIVTVEDYIGKDYREVKAYLEVRELIVDIETEPIENDAEFEDGQIIRQSVAKGETLRKNDRITLYVAQKGTRYPDFTDGTYEISDVEDFCQDNQIDLVINEIATEDETKNGKICEQSREAGSEAKPGATFRVSICKSNLEEDTTNVCSAEDRELGNC